MPFVPRELSDAQYRRIAQQNRVPVKQGEVTVMALRHGPDRRPGSNYEDEFIVFKANGQIERFIANTKSAQNGEQAVGGIRPPDVDGDGQRDVAMVRPGHYMAYGDGGRTFGSQVGLNRPAYRVTSAGRRDAVPAWRDSDLDGVKEPTDGDGFYSAAEKAANERAGITAGAIRIHIGFEATGERTPNGKMAYGPWSIGCLNVRNSDMDEFVSAVGGRKANFRISIVDAND